MAPLKSQERPVVSDAEPAGFGRTLRSGIRPLRAAETKIYLESLASSLHWGVSDFSWVKPDVELFRPLGKFFRNFSLPDGLSSKRQIFLSTSLLKQIEYENELVGTLAVEIFHLRHKTWFQRAWQVLQVDPKYDFKNFYSVRQNSINQGILAGWNQMEIDAFRSSVQVLYQSGYDPRGVVSLLQIYKKNVDWSPFDEKLVDVMIEVVRKEIAGFPPLRNPVIQSNRFLKIKERIRRL